MSRLAHDRVRPGDRKETIVIYQFADREGSTFSLSTESRRLLEERFKQSLHTSPRIFIAHSTQSDFERLHGDSSKQILLLLTGLTEDQVSRLRVEFRDPVTERRLSP